MGPDQAVTMGPEQPVTAIAGYAVAAAALRHHLTQARWDRLRWGFAGSYVLLAGRAAAEAAR